MVDANTSLFPRKAGASPLDGELTPHVQDGEFLVEGPRGRIGVTLSVRFLDSMDVWLYAAELSAHQPARGLWRWRHGTWERLSGGLEADPPALIGGLLDTRAWVNPPTADQRTMVFNLLRTLRRG